MDEERSKERADVPEPAPVSVAGTRYEAVPWGKARGLSQNGGYLAAIDEVSGVERSLIKVYNVSYDRDMEDDKLDVFITRITDQGDNKLRVENERGQVFLVDVRSQKVSGPLK